MSCIAHDEIGVKFEPLFSWRTTLSSNIFNTSSRLSFPGFYADLVFTLLTHAFALSNLARHTVLSLGRYEYDRAISDSERKAKDEKLNIAVTFLCRASGIYTYIGDAVLSEWETNRGGGPTGFDKPPELSREIHGALAQLALADAQSLAIRKLLSKSAYDSNIAPGPPLPSSHPSPALLAKLHFDCASLYSSALSLVKAVGSRKRPSSSSSDSAGEVSADLRRYLADEAAFHGALARKWLGVDAGENGSTERGGEAVGFLGWAKKELEILKDGGKGISVGKGDRGMRDRMKEKVNDELDKVNLFFKHYKKVNDSLHFQPVPTQADLQARIPAGRMAVAAKAFQPPVPAFGPGSVAYIRLQAEQLELLDSDKKETLDAEQSGNSGVYAGAGSYF